MVRDMSVFMYVFNMSDHIEFMCVDGRRRCGWQGHLDGGDHAPFSYLTLFCLIVNEISGPKRVTHHIFYSVQKIAVVQRKKRVVLTLPHGISNPKSLISLQPTKAFMRLS